MRRLLAVAALGEAATGLAVLLYPAIVTRLLFGAHIGDAGIVVSRVAGIALIGLGAGCWQARNDWSKDSPGLYAMLTYGVLVVIYLVTLGAGRKFVGPLLWPVVWAHSIISVLLAWQWHKARH